MPTGCRPGGARLEPALRLPITGSMPTAIVSLDAALLRSTLGVLALRPGQVLMGRVMERHGSHGVLVLAGRPLVAELPADVAAGARLRLVVAGSDGERVLLRVAPEPQPSAALSPPPPPPPPAPELRLALPGGEAQVRVADRAARGARPGRHHAVEVRLDAPALGAVEMRIELGPHGVRAAVAVAPGAPLAAAQAAAEGLRLALAGAAGAAASVSVLARHDPVDVRA
jgi:hypothetical protein